MKTLSKYLLNGIVALAPLAITAYVLFAVFANVNALGNLLIKPITATPIPGLGLLLTLALLIFIGFISEWYLGKKIASLIESLVNRFPLSKTIYNAIKDTLGSFTGEKKSFSQVVLIENNGVYRIGFLTAENLADFGLGAEYVAVYVSHGMQVSGELYLIERSKIRFIDTPVEDALKFCVSAGVAGKK